MSDRCGPVENLPLVLAGPILRRVQPTAVTVWLALRHPQAVTLKVCATYVNDLNQLGTTLGQNTQETVRLAECLHIVAITTFVETALEPGQLYAYNLEFSPLEDV
ncbi:MAG: hypothetical protein ACFCA4_09280 [Cyanophyceae cyanobacterium]